MNKVNHEGSTINTPTVSKGEKILENSSNDDRKDEDQRDNQSRLKINDCTQPSCRQSKRQYARISHLGKRKFPLNWRLWRSYRILPFSSYTHSCSFLKSHPLPEASKRVWLPSGYLRIKKIPPFNSRKVIMDGNKPQISIPSSAFWSYNTSPW